MTAARASQAPARGSVFRVYPPGEPLRPVVYRESIPPSKLYQSINSPSSSLSIPIFQKRRAPPGTTIEVRWHPAHEGIAGNEKADEWA